MAKTGLSRYVRYRRTDMAAELLEEKKTDFAAENAGNPEDGIVSENLEIMGLTVERVTLRTQAAADAFSKPQGRYITVHTGDPTTALSEEKTVVSHVLAEEMRCILHTIAPGAQRILVVGLGNRNMTVDALGSQTTDQICVYLPEGKTGAKVKLFTFAPGVLGQTGMETLGLVRGAVGEARAQAVILVDALACRGLQRLSRTIQISSVGIHPGSGVGNKRDSISYETLGIPVMTVGVPMVMDAASLIFEALEEAAMPPQAFAGECGERLQTVFDRNSTLFVSAKEADAATAAFSEVISGAVNLLFQSSGGYT